jgi:hypothetical protein
LLKGTESFEIVPYVTVKLEVHKAVAVVKAVALVAATVVVVAAEVVALIIIIQLNYYLFTCKLNSPEVNYKVNTMMIIIIRPFYYYSILYSSDWQK